MGFRSLTSTLGTSNFNLFLRNQHMQKFVEFAMPYQGIVMTFPLLIAALLIGRVVMGVQARLEGYSFAEQTVVHDNPALLVRLAGMMAALVIATFGVYDSSWGAFSSQGLESGITSLLMAMAALVVSRYVNDWAILSNVSNNDEVVKNRNVAVAVVEVGTYLATAFIFVGGMQGASYGDGATFNLVWFAIGQVMLIFLARVFWLFMPRVFDEIAKGNTACALSLAGFLLSGGLVIGVAIHGQFEGWAVDLMKVGFSVMAWLAVIGMSKLAMNWLVIPGQSMVREMVDDKNWGIGLFDAFVSVAFTVAIIFIHA